MRHVAVTRDAHEACGRSRGTRDEADEGRGMREHDAHDVVGSLPPTAYRLPPQDGVERFFPLAVVAGRADVGLAA